VVVRRDIARDRSHGGILLPDSFATEKKQTGTVWAVGPGRYENGVLIPIDLKKGERVIITGYAGLEIKDPLNTGSKDDEFVILREEDILAVLGG
jgi:chaperonin GroES